MKKMFILFVMITLLAAFQAAFSLSSEQLITTDGFVYIIKADGNAEIAGYTGPGGNIRIPEMIDGITVTSIGERAFEHNALITGVSIPGSIEEIKFCSFIADLSLKKVFMEEGIKEIGSSAFSECFNLETINFPNSITSIIYNPLWGCSKLQNVQIDPNHAYLDIIDGILYSKPDKRLIWYPMIKSSSEFMIPEGTEIIEQDSFFSSNVTIVSVPESVYLIGDYAFHSSKALTEINIPSKVKKLEGVFSYCDKLKNINVAENNPAFTSIDGVLYDKEKNILVLYPSGKEETSFIIPDFVQIIESFAFQGCNLERIIIPGTVKVIKTNAFNNNKLKNCEIMEGVTQIEGNAFSGSVNLESIILPDSLSSIQDNPFCSSKNLKRILISENHPYLKFENGCLMSKDGTRIISYLETNQQDRFEIPDGTEIIDANAFQNNKYLKEVVIPEGTVKIGYSSFSGCTNLARITLPKSLKFIDKTAFDIYSSADGNPVKRTYVVAKGSMAENFCQSYNLPIEYMESNTLINPTTEHADEHNFDPNIQPSEFSLETAGYAFEWGTPYDVVYDFLQNVPDLVIGIKKDDWISTTIPPYASFGFRFDKGHLYQIIISKYSLQNNSYDLPIILEELMSDYNLSEKEDYNNFTWLKMMSDADSSSIVTDDGTIYGLFSFDTENRKYVALYLLDRIFDEIGYNPIYDYAPVSNKIETEPASVSVSAIDVQPAKTNGPVSDTKPTETYTQAVYDEPSRVQNTNKVGNCKYGTNLERGDKAEIINVTALRMSYKPNGTVNEAFQAFPGKEFTIIDGPKCENSVVWWEINFLGYTGWVTEMGGDGTYYMQKK